MTPEALVRAYAREATPLHRRGDRGPEQLPSGAAILKLDAIGRARAIVETYRALPRTHANAYGRTIMLGLLATTLLRKNLPLDERDLETMTEHAAKAVGPAWGACDYDAALLKALRRADRMTPKTKRALRELMQRRGAKYSVDRRVCAACEKLIEFVYR